jgi:hypothetical protein
MQLDGEDSIKAVQVLGAIADALGRDVGSLTKGLPVR